MSYNVIDSIGEHAARWSYLGLGVAAAGDNDLAIVCGIIAAGQAVGYLAFSFGPLGRDIGRLLEVAEERGWVREGKVVRD